MRVRLMQAADLPAVMQIQTECYPPAMVEPADVLRERLHVAGAWAWVAEGGAGLGAYLCGYPSHLGKVTRLGAVFEGVDEPDCLYLHDLAVSPSAQGLGLGAALIRQAWAVAQRSGLTHSALVSVQASRAYWQGQGYALWPDLSPAQANNLGTYVAPAFYMVKALAGG